MSSLRERTSSPPSRRSATNQCPGSVFPELSCAAIAANADVDQARSARDQTGLLIGEVSLTFATFVVAAFAMWFARRAAHYTKLGSDEAKRSADAAFKANEITERHGVAQTRAYLSVLAKSFTFDEADGWFDFEFEATNSGQSPARKVSITTEMFYKKTAPHQGLQHMGASPPMETPGDIASGQRHVWKVGLDAFSGHPVLMLESGKTKLFTVSIKATYETIFEEVKGEDTFMFTAIIPPDGRDFRMQAPPPRGVILQVGETRKRGEPAVVGIWHSPNPVHQANKPQS